MLGWVFISSASKSLARAALLAACAWPGPALEGRQEGTPASHVSCPCPDWNLREMAWTRTGTFLGARGKGITPQTLPCPAAI